MRFTVIILQGSGQAAFGRDAVLLTTMRNSQFLHARIQGARLQVQTCGCTVRSLSDGTSRPPSVLRVSEPCARNLASTSAASRSDHATGIVTCENRAIRRTAADPKMEVPRQHFVPMSPGCQPRRIEATARGECSTIGRKSVPSVLPRSPNAGFITSLGLVHVTLTFDTVFGDSYFGWQLKQPAVVDARVE